MPFYFAYGSNLDLRAMAHRCPGAEPLGPGTLEGHRFFIMADGYASVRIDAAATVHGLLWTIPDHDVPALDDYEEVDAGLYRKALVLVDRPSDAPLQALIYIGANEETGWPSAAYMGAVIAAAAGIGLPASYRNELLGWMP